MRSTSRTATPAWSCSRACTIRAACEYGSVRAGVAAVFVGVVAGGAVPPHATRVSTASNRIPMLTHVGGVRIYSRARDCDGLPSEHARAGQLVDLRRIEDVIDALPGMGGSDAQAYAAFAVPPAVRD